MANDRGVIVESSAEDYLDYFTGRIATLEQNISRLREGRNIAIKELHKQGWTVRKLASHAGLSTGTVRLIVSEKDWSRE